MDDSTAPPVLKSRWPLTPLEEFLWLNDDPSHPMVIRLLMKFSGPGERGALEESFQQAIERHPFFRSRLEATEGQLRLVPGDIPGLIWRDTVLNDDDVVRHPINPIDLTREPGSRTQLWPVAEGLWVMLDVHHVCGDGQSIRQFLTEWFALYWKLTGGAPRPLPELIPARLAERDQYSVTGPVVGFWEGMRNLAHTLGGRTARLPQRSGGNQGEVAPSWLEERVLTPEETAQVRERLRAAGMTMNSLGLAASIAAFAAQFPEASRGRLVTVINPVDLRRPSDLRLPACNRLGFVFIRRRVPPGMPFAQLIASIHAEMRYIKDKHVGGEFGKGLAAVRGFPGIRRMINWGWFTPSLLFTCPGDSTSLFRHKKPAEEGVVAVKGLQLERITGYAPLGRGFPISLAACETNNCLCLTVRASDRYLTAAQTTEFADAFRDNLFRGAQQLTDES